MSHHLYRRVFRVIVALICAAMTITAVPVDAQSGATLRVGYIPSEFAGQVIFAKELGLFEKTHLNVELLPFTNGPAIASAVLGGSVDIGYSNIVSLAIAHEKGFPFKLIAPASIYDSKRPTVGTLGTLRTTGINSAKDLRDKIIAVGGLNNIVDLATRVWIDKNGGDSRTVKIVEIPISQMGEAVISGRVAAANMVASSYPTLGRPGDPLHIIGYTYNAISPYFVQGGWFSTSDWIANHPAEARAFASTMAETARWAAQHPHEVVGYVAKYLKNDPAQLEVIQRETFGTILTPQLLQPPIDVAAKYHFIQAAFPSTDLISVPER